MKFRVKFKSKLDRFKTPYQITTTHEKKYSLVLTVGSWKQIHFIWDETWGIEKTEKQLETVEYNITVLHLSSWTVFINIYRFVTLVMTNQPVNKPPVAYVTRVILAQHACILGLEKVPCFISI